MMPWRQRFITSRRHPLALASYLVTLVLGLLFLVHVIDTSFLPVSQTWKILWRIELVAGGASGLAFSLIRPRVSPHWPDLADVLRLEGIAALVSTIGFATYIVAIEDVAGPGVHAVTVLLSIMSLGMLGRSVQCFRDSSFVERMAALSTAAEEHATHHDEA